MLRLVSYGSALKLSHRKMDPVLFPIDIGNPSQTIYTSLTFESSLNYFFRNSFCSDPFNGNESIATIGNLTGLYCNGNDPNNKSTTYAELSNDDDHRITIGNEIGTFYNASDNVSIRELNWSNNFNMSNEKTIK